MHQSGFVNIVGKPNVGKSTLMNALLGQELSMVNAKAQTTRHRIKGILNDNHYQIVFSDTPGIMKPAYKLHHKMLAAVEETFTDADVVIYVTEVNDRRIEDELKDKLTVLSVPLYVVINKIDTAEQSGVEEAVNFWKETLHPKVILPISALHQFSVNNIVTELLKDIPEG
ncbi:MAG: GTPase Era, partial [Bacteroidota bacterium]